MALKFGITKTLTAHDKFEEAKFFYGKMLKHERSPTFRFYLSAFLSALTSSIEKEALFSSEPWFGNWHAEKKATILAEPLCLLRELRNAEIHHAGSPLYQEFGFNFGPEGILLEGEKQQVLEVGPIVLDDPSTYRYRVDTGDTIGESMPLNASLRWVWTADGSPDVLQLCRQGLGVVGGLLADWDSQKLKAATAS